MQNHQLDLQAPGGDADLVQVGTSEATLRHHRQQRSGGKVLLVNQLLLAVRDERRSGAAFEQLGQPAG